MMPGMSGKHFRKNVHQAVQPIFQKAGEEPGVAIAEIDPVRLQQVRQQMPSLQHRVFA